MATADSSAPARACALEGAIDTKRKEIDRLLDIGMLLIHDILLLDELVRASHERSGDIEFSKKLCKGLAKLHKWEYNLKMVLNGIQVLVTDLLDMPFDDSLCLNMTDEQRRTLAEPSVQEYIQWRAKATAVNPSNPLLRCRCQINETVWNNLRTAVCSYSEATIKGLSIWAKTQWPQSVTGPSTTLELSNEASLAEWDREIAKKALSCALKPLSVLLQIVTRILNRPTKYVLDTGMD